MRVRAAVVALAVVATAGAGTALAAGGLPGAARAASPATAAGRAGTTRPATPPGFPKANGVAQASRLTVAPPPAVAPLRTLRTPDLLVSLPGSLSASQVAALHAIPGLRGMTLLDFGTVHLGAGQSVQIAGVDPGQFRQFTPRETATSNPLWAAVARGEIAPTYGLVRSRHLGRGARPELGAWVVG